MKFCTYFDWNYRHKGLALWESLEWHCPSYHLWILTLDKRVQDALYKLNLPNVSLISMDSFETEALRACRPPARSVREFYWTCTPSWILYVMKVAEAVNYVDADCYFYADPQPVFDEIGNAPLGITPHDFPPRLRSMENNGIFNVGLVYVKRAGLDCVREWEAQCLNWCFLKHDHAHPDWFCDQKYLDRWPQKWGAHAIRHPGANRAPWNMEHRLWEIRNGHVHVDGQKLLWFHYHGWEGPAQRYPSTYIASPLHEKYVFEPYGKALGRARGRIG